MSIINDALKKVQSSLSSAEKKAPETSTPVNNTNPAPATPAADSQGQTQTVSSAVAKPSKGKESKLVYILGALCLLIALFAPIVNKQSVFGLIVSKIPVAKKTKPVPPPIHRSAVTATKKSVVTQATEIKQEISRKITSMKTQPKASSTPRSAQRITVNGIMSQGKQNVALIDGQIYETGETVDGAKIIQINLNTIVVEENGTQRTIKVTGQ